MALTAYVRLTTPFAGLIPGKPVQATLSVLNTGAADVTLTSTSLNLPLNSGTTTGPYNQITATCPAGTLTTVGSWGVVFNAPQSAFGVPSPCTFALSASIGTASATADSTTQTVTMYTGIATQPTAAGSLTFNSSLCSAYPFFF